MQLAPGSHHVEIRAPGRRTYVSDVTIRAGETTPLNVSLTVATPRPEPPPAFAAADAHAGRRPAGTGPHRPDANADDGPVFAPDVKFTEVNHEFATLVGAYGGYVFGGQVMFGGGGYWQANSTNGVHIAYGGPVVEWRALRGRTIGLNLHALVGGGTGYSDTTAITATIMGLRRSARPRAAASWSSRRVRYGYPYQHYYDAFFVADPEAQLVIHSDQRAPAGQRRVPRDLDQQPQRRDWRDFGPNRTLTSTPSGRSAAGTRDAAEERRAIRRSPQSRLAFT